MRRLTIRFAIAILVLLTLSRLGLSAWQWDRVQAAGGLGPIMLGGLRMDLRLLALVLALPAVLAPWFGHRAWAASATAWWYRVWWMLFVLLEVSTPQFIAEYDTRPNRLYFEYLVHPREVASMLWEGYKGVLLASFVVLVLAAWLAVRLFPTGRQDGFMKWWKRPFVTLAVLAVVVLAARGTLQHRPINASMVAFSSDAMVNTLPLNSLGNVLDAAYRLQDERSSAALYPPMKTEEMNRIVRAAAGLEDPPLDARYPSLHKQTATVRRDKPLNLVIILQESLGAQYVGSLGGRDLTPQLDRLAKDGWMFNRAYATGTRSVRGLEAVTAGFLPTVAEAVLKLPRSQTGFFTLADLLGRHGFHSRFIYGGEAHFDNMRGFFLGNGFNEVIDRQSFVDPVFVGSWGASDEDMFNQLDRLLRADDGKSTFTLAFSVSNHSPWEYPAGRIEPVGDPASVDNTVRYADWAMGQFFDKARKAPYWDNTVFLVIADHDSRVYGANLVPVRHFQIPALILGGTVPPRSDDRIVSQIDMGPTLLSLIGLDNVNPMLGADLTQRDPNRAIMQYGDNFGYLKGDSLLVIEPGKDPREYRYTAAASMRDEKYIPIDIDPALRDEALAFALWPSWAYREERYKLPK
ncbi:arylsulfatase [Bordetella bronchiseptica E012]|uniref:Arylsulfatase n=1 Tax=Bordetella bronchiseptica 00-P-2796 TaxID=1331199 RepID=A0ABR4RLQ7_BORBO|nr:arylsulfatase [Bordetella bronchiseptica 00-P-2796]KCV46596.1 arylsulfatase [Bordetella bronchiseptica 3E44]KCV60219.1 arylsulfatase [Bordetella bronchiseptica 980]KDB57666.1 arylsulfatase [Bordetella bronchiseptica B18-5 (C3)]KDB62453.1 arylsulfatase [Bordetella bronchiseptica A1-7]KDB74483.1 arylsulfatase [Bordetella bronchiseptica B20-10725633]KDB85003.1 arylsulfatase [Bordetella bronchiseptica D756]KDB92056.1 arylsulfatase [Bordetella bronchiseptica D989]KDB95637.1 arylsulfatase [Bor